MAAPRLFSEMTLRDVTLKNRIVVSPMSMYDATAEGLPTYWHDMHYGNLAVSGPGMIVVEATYVSPDVRSTPGDLGLWNTAQAEALNALLRRWQSVSTSRFGLQISHAGRKGATAVAWHPDAVPDWPLLAPSANAFDGGRTPEAMSQVHIEETVADFVRSAQLAAEAGFDYLELHAGHGYLLHSFLSPVSNLREDDYGGCLENRMRLLLRVCSAVRAVWPDNRPLGVRLSCTDWIEGGWDLAQSVVLASRLKDIGCDLVTASSGGASLQQVIPRGPGYQAPFSARIREAADLPTLAVGMIDEPELAEYLLVGGQADLIGVGRAMLYNPRWAWHAARALGVSPDFPPHYARAVKEYHRAQN